MSSTSFSAEIGRVSCKKPLTVSKLSLPVRRAIRVALLEGCCTMSSLAGCISHEAYPNDHCESINALLRLRDIPAGTHGDRTIRNAGGGGRAAQATHPLRRLFAAEQEDDFDDEDDDDGEFEYEAASLIKLVDHEPVEFAGGAKLLLDQAAVIGNADFRGDEVVEAGIEHVAQKLDGVVDFFRELHDIETDGVDASGLAGQAPVAEAASFVLEEAINAVQHVGQQPIVVAKFEKLSVGVFKQLNRGGRHFPAA